MSKRNLILVVVVVVLVAVSFALGDYTGQARGYIRGQNDASVGLHLYPRHNYLLPQGGW